MLSPKMSRSTNHASIFSILFLGLVIALTMGMLRNSIVPASAQESTAVPAKAVAAPKMVAAPSKNFRAMSSRKIDTVVVHYISAVNVDAKRWADPQLALSILKRFGVSSHYLIDRAGTIYQLVPEKDIAWHAGGSIMPAPDNRKNVNSFSIGIEIVATEKSGFTDAQYASLTHLTKQIQARHPIKHIVGHDDIAGVRAVKMGLRKDVKQDPGPNFDWSRFRQMLRAE